MRMVVFANGEMSDPKAAVAQWARPGDCLVAADGGARHALAAGARLQHVIGDMDSLDPGLRRRLAATDTAFHTAPVAKDETDLELVLLWAVSQPAVSEIVVLGALGGRPDQAQANVLLLGHPALAGRRVWMAAGRWEIQVIRAGESLTISGAPDDTLSLIPLGGAAHGVSTGGLVYPLADETLDFGPARGVSNRFLSDTATVSVREGLLWCYHERSLPTATLSASGGLDG